MKIERIFPVTTNKNDLKKSNKNTNQKKKKNMKMSSFDEILKTEMQKKKKLSF